MTRQTINAYTATVRRLAGGPVLVQQERSSLLFSGSNGRVFPVTTDGQRVASTAPTPSCVAWYLGLASDWR